MNWQRTVKRGLDLAVSATALLAAAPLLGVLVLLIRRRMGRPAMFRQLRPGLHGVPFTVYKLRTMVDANGPDGRPLPDGERLTPLGRFLRRASLDELPQLWNVLRGDMSLVGPRPLRVEYLDRYTPEQARRHEAQPGITGWAQIHGRNAVSWEQRFVLDVWYVDHWTLWLDLRILAGTVWRVLRPQGISAANCETMPEFLGTSRG